MCVQNMDFSGANQVQHLSHFLAYRAETLAVYFPVPFLTFLSPLYRISLQVILNIISGAMHEGNVSVVSPRNGPIASRFVEIVKLAPPC